MAFSLVRSLTASVFRNLGSVNRDAKRLHRRSPDVFGQQYPLSVIQTAIAVSKGYQSFNEVKAAAARVGMDRDEPFWTIRSRNDYHELVLEALYTLELESLDSGPVVFLGPQASAAPAALVMLVEEMSHRKLPGLVMIETQASVVQDTVLYSAVTRLGLDETLSGFRVLDLRDRTIPVAIATSVHCWVSAIMGVLPRPTAQAIEDSGWRAAVEASIEANALSMGYAGRALNPEQFFHIPFQPVKDGAMPIAYGGYWPMWFTDEQRMYAEMNVASKPPSIAETLKEPFMDIVRDLAKREFSTGRVVEKESRHRPYVVLFSREDEGSVVLAAAVHSLFHARYVSSRAARPMLYLCDRATPYTPRFLSFGEQTLVVSGRDSLRPSDAEDEWYGYRVALKVGTSARGIEYMGKRVSLGEEAGPGQSVAGMVRGQKAGSGAEELILSAGAVEDNPVHAEALELLRTLPPHMVEMFRAIWKKRDFEEQRAGWVETQEGLEVNIVILRELGRAPSLILDDLIEHKLCLRGATSPGMRMLLSHAAGALIKGHIRALS